MSADKYYTLAEGTVQKNASTLIRVCNNKLGCPFAANNTTLLLRAEGGGSLGLLQDTQLIETLAHFSRERIPER